jgi:FKBP-type peptidyl-prolyl cis-trans isomerase (trigger factor)
MDSLIGRTPIQVPEVLVTEEQDTLFDEQKRYIERIGLNFEQFLLTAGKSAEQFKAELRDPADKRVRRNLILDAVIEAEHIEPPSEEIDADVREVAESSAKSERDYDRLLQSTRLRHVIEESAARNLALAHLVKVVTGVDMQHDHDHDHDDDGLDVDEPAESEPVAEESAVEAGTT